jgi:hypothetical protein
LHCRRRLRSSRQAPSCFPAFLWSLHHGSAA